MNTIFFSAVLMREMKLYIRDVLFFCLTAMMSFGMVLASEIQYSTNNSEFSFTSAANIKNFFIKHAIGPRRADLQLLPFVSHWSLCSKL